MFLYVSTEKAYQSFINHEGGRFVRCRDITRIILFHCSMAIDELLQKECLFPKVSNVIKFIQ